MMMRSVASLLAAAALWWFSGAALADPVVGGEEHCVVNVRSDDRLNMREAPVASARIVTRKRHDDCGIMVTGDCHGNWCPAEDGHHAGWLHRRYIAMVSPARYCVTGVAHGDVLNLRAYPASTSRVLTRLSRHQCDIALLPYATGGWQKIRWNGWQGWVSRRYLSGQ